MTTEWGRGGTWPTAPLPGRWTASASAAGPRRPATPPVGYEATLWDISDPAQPTAISTMRGGSGTVAAFSFSADAKTLAVSTESVREIWNLTDRTRPTLISHASFNYSERVVF